MKVYSNDKYISRNKKISKVLMITSLVFLGFSFIAMLNTSTNSTVFFLSLIAGLLGIILSTLNIPLSNRFGTSPRPDELITRSLKGLGDEFSLFHYSADAPHLLVSHNGIWILMPYMVKGKVQYDGYRRKWKLAKTGNFLTRFFGSEGLGNPTKEAHYLVKDFNNSVRKKPEFRSLPSPTPVALFLTEPIQFEVDETPFPVMSSEKIKPFMRRSTNLPKEDQANIQKYLEDLLLKFRSDF